MKPIQSQLDTLLCILSYPLQCLMVDQLTEAAESNQLTDEAKEEVRTILHHLRTHGTFHYETNARYPKIDKRPSAYELGR